MDMIVITAGRDWPWETKRDHPRALTGPTLAWRDNVVHLARSICTFMIPAALNIPLHLTIQMHSQTLDQ